MSLVEKTQDNFFYETISDWPVQKTTQIPYNKQSSIEKNIINKKNNLTNQSDSFHSLTSSPILQSPLTSKNTQEINLLPNYFSRIKNKVCKDITKNLNNKNIYDSHTVDFNTDFLFNNDNNVKELIEERHLMHSSISTSSRSISPYSNSDSVAAPSSINSSCGAIVSNGNSATSFTTNGSGLVLQKKSKKDKPVIICIINKKIYFIANNKKNI